jgi:succinate dehydrogenase / fumarate reductase cytochrome b subunit
MSTGSTPAANRPLSPFMLGIYYRFQWSSLLSFAHRVTGIGLSLGTLLLAGGLIALAGGERWYELFHAIAASWVGQILLFGWSWALLYHLCNGIRHLFWDVGHGYSLKVAERSGYAVVVVSAALTVGCWALAYLHR